MNRDMAEVSAPVFRMNHINLRYNATGSDVLHDINLIMPAHSFLCLTGPSGAGKSSLLRLLCLAAAPSSGSLELFGQNTTHLPDGEKALIRRKLGVIFQDFRLVPHLTLLDNVALPLRLAGRAAHTIDGPAKELLGWVGLAGREQDYPSALSGGEQQRVAIARAVINNPQLILADEPTGNLDEANADRVLRLLTELYRSGTSVILATHQRRVLVTLQQPVYEMRGGRLLLAPRLAMAS